MTGLPEFVNAPPQSTADLTPAAWAAEMPAMHLL
jgi:hypothetical protein